YYLGANVPEQELIKLLIKVKPRIVAISVTMPFNLERAESLIKSVRKVEKVRPKIIVGGIAFNIIPEIYKEIGADFWASDAKQAVEIASHFKN
ncbi:MAG: cobalamin-dependent protein, partial [Thermodesulfovibrio sp.]|nr:cobalamin-dependent protein [Thermodesulfovibrio sp.]